MAAPPLRMLASIAAIILTTSNGGGGGGRLLVDAFRSPTPPPAIAARGASFSSSSMSSSFAVPGHRSYRPPGIDPGQRRVAVVVTAVAARGSTPSSSLFGRPPASRRRLRSIARAARRSLAVILASFSMMFLFSPAPTTGSLRVVPPAHAASASTYPPTSSSTAMPFLGRVGPFRVRTADELIDEYVRDRMFSDDSYDPVESAYREACADHPSGGGGSGAGAYPTILAETASAALGQKGLVTVVPSSSSSSSSSNSKLGGGGGRNDGITGALMKASDVLQSRLRISAAMSYYVLGASGLVGVLFVPAMVGVLYQGIQRQLIDRGEMKMYGKISE